MIKVLIRFTVTALLLGAGLNAQAGHLFTQNVLNTPVLLNAGQGITIPQETMEGASPTASSDIDLQDFGSGDTLRMTIGGIVRTFPFDSMPADWQASATSIRYITGNDPQLAALNLAVPFNWRIDAVAGSFTVEGFRVRIASGTVNGTGAGVVNQALVTTTSSAIPIFSPVHILLLVLALVGIAGVRQRILRRR